MERLHICVIGVAKTFEPSFRKRLYTYIHYYEKIHMHEKKSLQVKGVSQKLKNSAFEEEIQSIYIKVLPKMHKYVKNYSQRKLV